MSKKQIHLIKIFPSLLMFFLILFGNTYGNDSLIIQTLNEDKINSDVFFELSYRIINIKEINLTDHEEKDNIINRNCNSVKLFSNYFGNNTEKIKNVGKYNNKKSFFNLISKEKVSGIGIFSNKRRNSWDFENMKYFLYVGGSFAFNFDNRENLEKSDNLGYGIISGLKFFIPSGYNSVKSFGLEFQYSKSGKNHEDSAKVLADKVVGVNKEYYILTPYYNFIYNNHSNNLRRLSSLFLGLGIGGSYLKVCDWEGTYISQYDGKIKYKYKNYYEYMGLSVSLQFGYLNFVDKSALWGFMSSVQVPNVFHYERWPVYITLTGIIGLSFN